ncbi:alpha/beta fold hydrolase [Rhizobium sp. NZLR8]|uniref:alpha/beta fold hydrolase n=1 Tax=Rhizobium sp. NZLR8 TaxID=2731104 RepID=UPI001C834D79|nr:alpha/beta fold hydrolase [Rhizobium sp. NZLR8]MBX5157546.1 alpha/beta fold hydrolase [Rhizobium sp. NZLR8]
MMTSEEPTVPAEFSGPALSMPALSMPAWVDREAYPFTSKWFDLPDGRMHYIDEGEGDILLFAHGNPSWSFEYRHLIRHFSSTHRCIALDYLGFGLSDKPPHLSYLPQFHSANLGRFIEGLDLKNITLVFQDWGGPIALSYAVANPSRVSRIIASNSWFFDVREYPAVRRFSHIIGSAFGRMLCKHLNLFPRVLLKASFGDSSRLGPEVHAQYLAPFPTAAERKGTWVFPRAIVGESSWLAEIWARRHTLKDRPILLIWGMKDPGCTPLLPRWTEVFTDHRLITLDDVGHNVAEEAGRHLIGPIASFLSDRSPS